MGCTKNENGDLVIVQEEAEIVRLISDFIWKDTVLKDKPVPRGEWHKNCHGTG